MQCATFGITANGAWGISVYTGSNPTSDWADVTIGSDNGVVDLQSVSVAQGSGGELQAKIYLDSNSIDDVECVAIFEDTLDRLWLRGGMQGDLERLDVTEIGDGFGQFVNLPFLVEGDVGLDASDFIILREVDGVSDLDQVRGFLIEGDLILDIDAQGGGIGNLAVYGRIEKGNGGPVNIRALHDIGNISGGEVHANIIAGHDFGDGSTTANVRQVNAYINDGPTSGLFRGTIRGNTWETRSRVTSPAGRACRASKSRAT